MTTHDHAVCASGIGQLGQFFSRRVAVSCTVVNLLWLAGIAAVVGVAVFVGGLALFNGPGRRHSPPGWYPDPANTAAWRYWDGYRWTAATAPRRR